MNEGLIKQMGYKAYFQDLKQKNKLAMDTIQLQSVKGIPTGLFHIMQHDHIERIAGVGSGEYRENPEEVYIKMLKNIGVNIVDQYLADNPLSMGDHGYEGTEHGATTGAEQVVVNGIVINSPEDVIDHLEKFEFSRLKADVNSFNEEVRVKEILDNEMNQSVKYGKKMLKTGYGYITFPYLYYFKYGYANYFMAYALYPEEIEQHFSLQADLALLNNRAAAIAYKAGGLPPMYRLDHDMADSRGTLVNEKSLDKIWVPHFARCLEPVLKTDMRMIWHCDGNLMKLVPKLIDVGIKGFQGFQYEDGMDYVNICKMKTKDGEDLLIEGGVSVTCTLPFGTPEDIKREMRFLVDNGPKTGLFLSTSSTIAPGVRWDNVETMLEGFKYYRTHGRH